MSGVTDMKHPFAIYTVMMTLVALLGALPVRAASQAAGHWSLATDRLIVSPTGPYFTIESALTAAQTGNTIEVHGGMYPALVVEKSITLEGVDWPVIDGGGQGTVVTLAAPDIVLRGFEVRGSGVDPDHDHSGVTLVAPRIIVENNRLRDVLFGVFVAQADGAVVRGNDITGKAKYDEGRKGDGIRLWYSQNVTVEGNYVHETRDVVLWYSEAVIVRDNVIEHGRYGVHLMYCNGAQIEDNQLLHNSIGIYTMYSTDVALRRNLIRGQRGPSGYALGFKDTDNVVVVGNTLVDNHAGLFLDGTPFSPQGSGLFQDNILAFNDVGAILLPAVRGNVFESNTFWENAEQMALQGGGKAGANVWQGNYWSDYTGFDADGNGVGDLSYRADRFFEALTDREPLLRALLYSPAAQAIEFAASAFPVVRPQPKLTDPAPRVQPIPLPVYASPPKTADGAMGGVVLALAGLGVLSTMKLFRTFTLKARRHEGKAPLASVASSSPRDLSEIVIRAQHIRKHYGAVTALEDVSFDVYAGEALALWGANGAGKTTLLKAMLGLIDFEGQIHIVGHEVLSAGKNARRNIGYVPQEMTFYDMPVLATLEFYARLKQSNPARIRVLLERLGLAEHAQKSVLALSGGLKQRLALAIALLADPPVLLLDEPTASLDAQARHDYLALLTTLRKEDHKSTIFASHHLEEVEVLANRVMLLEDGQLVDVLDPLELLARLRPEVELTLWVSETQRPDALAYLQKEGLSAHLNGHGTIVVRLRAGGKMQLLHLLRTHGICVFDFEIQGSNRWN